MHRIKRSIPIFSLLLIVTVIVSACGKTENPGLSVDFSSSGNTGGDDSSQTVFASGYGSVDKNGETAAEAVQRLVEDTENDIYDRSMISIEEVNNCFLCDRDLAKKTISEAHSEQIAEKGIYGYAEVYVSNKVKLLNDCDLGNEGDVYDRQEIFYMVMPDKDSPWEVMDHTIEFPVTGAREVSEITFTSVYGGVDKNGKTAAEAVQRRSNDDNGGYDRSQVTLEGIVYCFDVDEDIAMNKSTAEERVSQADEKGVYGYAIVQVNQRIRILKDCSLGKAGDAYDRLVSYVMIMQDKNSPWEEKGSGVVPYDYKKAYERYISRKTE